MMTLRNLIISNHNPSQNMMTRLLATKSHRTGGMTLPLLTSAYSVLPSAARMLATIATPILTKVLPLVDLAKKVAPFIPLPKMIDWLVKADYRLPEIRDELNQFIKLAKESPNSPTQMRNMQIVGKLIDLEKRYAHLNKSKYKDQFNQILSATITNSVRDPTRHQTFVGKAEMDLALLSKYLQDPTAVPSRSVRQWFRDPANVLVDSYKIHQPESITSQIAEAQSLPSSQVAQLQDTEFDPAIQRANITEVPRFAQYKGPTTLTHAIEARTGTKKS